MKARTRYSQLSGTRNQFLDKAVEGSKLTLPYLIRQDTGPETMMPIKTPWQSVGAKAVVTLAAKLMLALLPPQTAFFKLQVRDDKLQQELDPRIKSELDLSMSKMERMVMDYLNATSDRVVVHEAIKSLVVGGNALLYYSKDGLRHYPFNRFVVNRDGDGRVLEIVTKELVNKNLIEGYPIDNEKQVNDAQSGVGGNGPSGTAGKDDVEVYTYVKFDTDKGRWTWHQEVNDKIIPGSKSSAPKDVSPWMVLRFSTVDGEDYGRGRVEEFLGDLKSLEALSQAIIEGSAAAAKVVFLVSPSATTKPQTIANAGNGAIVQGRPDDVGVIQVGKTADFKTAYDLASVMERRIGEAFLVLQVRNSERTTAEEVRLTQMELDQQLGGLYSLLTTEFLVPYLNRTLFILQQRGQLPKIPKDLVRPTVVAGVNALGRGQDYQSLTQFITTIAQTMGPEAIQQYIDPGEYMKRLAAAQGIDTLNLIKTNEQLQQEMQQQQAMQEQQSLVDQTAQLEKVNVDQQKADVESAQALAEAQRQAPKAKPMDQDQTLVSTSDAVIKQKLPLKMNAGSGKTTAVVPPGKNMKKPKVGAPKIHAPGTENKVNVYNPHNGLRVIHTNPPTY